MPSFTDIPEKSLSVFNKIPSFSSFEWEEQLKFINKTFMNTKNIILIPCFFSLLYKLI